MNKNTYKKILHDSTPELTAEQRALVWRRVQSATTARGNVLSPYWSFLELHRTVAYLGVFVVCMLIGTTSVAAQNARPGDVLFPVEQALEQVRLALSVSDTKRAALEIRFAEERLRELQSLLADTTATQDVSVVTNNIALRAVVYLDQTIVEIQRSGRVQVVESTARDSAAIVTDLAQMLMLSPERVREVLSVNYEDRMSRISDRKGQDDERLRDERVQEAIRLLERLVERGDMQKQKRFTQELLVTLYGDENEYEDFSDDLYEEYDSDDKDDDDRRAASFDNEYDDKEDDRVDDRNRDDDVDDRDEYSRDDTDDDRDVDIEDSRKDSDDDDNTRNNQISDEDEDDNRDDVEEREEDKRDRDDDADDDRDVEKRGDDSDDSENDENDDNDDDEESEEDRE